ncbi:MAG: queuosine precursor transporter [Sphaerochaetaceae bacterium]|nr:queuosine precursor transporter [Sphaerochaetaceae bacterium]
MEKINEKNIGKRDFLFALFIASMVIVNTLGSKITTILGVRVSVGIFLVPVLFLVTDIIGEVFGSKEAQHFVNTATIMLVFMFVLSFLFIKLSPNETWGLQKEYETIFGSSMRMTGASIISFVISQKLDVVLFSAWKKVTHGKHLWIRNNFSTIISQFIDTTIFDFIAFYHMTEKYTVSFVFSLIIPYWLFKVVFALLDTPFCYLGVKWMKGELKK